MAAARFPGEAERTASEGERLQVPADAARAEARRQGVRVGAVRDAAGIHDRKRQSQVCRRF